MQNSCMYNEQLQSHPTSKEHRQSHINYVCVVLLFDGLWTKLLTITCNYCSNKRLNHWPTTSMTGKPSRIWGKWTSWFVPPTLFVGWQSQHPLHQRWWHNTQISQMRAPLVARREQNTRLKVPNIYFFIARRHGPVIWMALHNEGNWWMDTISIHQYIHQCILAFISCFLMWI